jgi:predicted nuclease with TOPRIM domain
LAESNNELSSKASSLETELSDATVKIKTLETEKTTVVEEAEQTKAAINSLNTKVGLSSYLDGDHTQLIYD